MVSSSLSSPFVTAVALIGRLTPRRSPDSTTSFASFEFVTKVNEIMNRNEDRNEDCNEDRNEDCNEDRNEDRNEDCNEDRNEGNVSSMFFELQVILSSKL